jgi:hypothetical protein
MVKVTPPERPIGVVVVALVVAELILFDSVSAQSTAPNFSPIVQLRHWTTLPAEQNAALAFLQVAQAWVEPAKRMASPKLPEDLHRPNAPVSDDDLPKIHEWLDYWQDELNQLDAISGIRQFDWGDPPPSPFVLHREDPRFQLGAAFASNLLRFDALFAARDDDPQRAWQRIEQLWLLSDAVYRWPEQGARGYSRVNVDRPMCTTLAIIAGNVRFLQFARSDRDQLLRASRRLVDDAEARERFRIMIQCERAILADTQRAMATGQLQGIKVDQLDPWNSLSARILSEGAREQLPTLPKVLDTYASLEQPGEPLVRAHRDAVWRERIQSALQSDPRAHALAGSIGPILATEFDFALELLAYRRLAGTALAIAVYRADHDGQWPQSLEQLVPQYLPEVPQDPLSIAAVPIQYRAAPRPLIWSTGRDGKNHSGRQSSDDMPASVRRDQTDLVFPLN